MKRIQIQIQNLENQIPILTLTIINFITAKFGPGKPTIQILTIKTQKNWAEKRNLDTEKQFLDKKKQKIDFKTKF